MDALSVSANEHTSAGTLPQWTLSLPLPVCRSIVTLFELREARAGPVTTAGGTRVKVALTDLAASTLTVHVVADPVHAPPQPAKVDVLSGDSESVTEGM